MIRRSELDGAAPATLRAAAYVSGVLAADTGTDRPSHVIGLGATRELPAELRQQAHATAFAVGPVLGVDAPAGTAVPVTTRHAPPLELVAGRTLRAGLDAVVVLGDVRLPYGGPTARVALGVTRDGDEVHGVRPDDGDVDVGLVPAAAALAPSDPAHDGAALPGVLVAAVRRYLSLPTAPPSADPWLLLTDAWATLALDSLEQARRRSTDGERWARRVVALRPDVALLTQRRARAFLGGDPDAVALREAYAEPPPALDGALPATAVRSATDPAATLADVTAAAVAELADERALWDAACVLFPAPDEGQRVAAPEWYDGNALARHVVAEVGGQPGATARLLADEGVPAWLAASTRAWLAASRPPG